MLRRRDLGKELDFPVRELLYIDQLARRHNSEDLSANAYIKIYIRKTVFSHTLSLV